LLRSAFQPQALENLLNQVSGAIPVSEGGSRVPSRVIDEIGVAFFIMNRNRTFESQILVINPVGHDVALAPHVGSRLETYFPGLS
jgi:hypothetical protein